jgi:prepilin-type N-terminal cleavage/methylation domain-containing protein
MRRLGVTLVELLIAVAVSSVVLGGAYQLLGLGGSASERSARGEAAVDASRAFLQLAPHLRFARAVALPSPDRLELDGRDGEAWTITLEGDELLLTEAHGPGREVLAGGISEVTFFLGEEPPWLEVVLTVGQGPGRSRYQTGYYLKGRLRMGEAP